MANGPQAPTNPMLVPLSHDRCEAFHDWVTPEWSGPQVLGSWNEVTYPPAGAGL